MKEIYIANKEKEYDEFSFTTLEEYSLSIPFRNVCQVKAESSWSEEMQWTINNAIATKNFESILLAL